MHKYGPDAKCHELHNASQLKNILRQVKWVPQPSTASAATNSAAQMSVEPTVDKLSKQIAALDTSISRGQKNALKQMHSALSTQLHRQMQALATSVNNKIEDKLKAAHSSRSSIPADHVVIPVKEMHQLLDHLEDIKAAPIPLEGTQDSASVKKTSKPDFLSRAKA